MTIKEARAIELKFEQLKCRPSDEELFLYFEAMKFLIAKENNPRDMMILGGEYYKMEEFDLALKYYEMAAAMDYDCAYECLGYFWYYGRTGERDYKKAYEYFSKVAATGNIVAMYKIADMYKNGYYVEKNQEKYEEIIEKLYHDSKRWSVDPAEVDISCLPFPEIYTRLAKIKKDRGMSDDAINLYLEAKTILARRIRFDAFFGNLNIMKLLIDDLYTLQKFDWEDFDFYDLYFVLKAPDKVQFYYGDKVYTIESVQEDGFVSVLFDGKWYRDRDDFFRNAEIDKRKLTAICDDIYGLVDLVTRSVRVKLNSFVDNQRFNDLFLGAIKNIRDKMNDYVVCDFSYEHPAGIKFIQCVNNTNDYVVEVAVIEDDTNGFIDKHGRFYNIYRACVPNATAAIEVFRQITVDGQCPDLIKGWENFTPKVKRESIK